jgi:sugar phosphate isomerase/epimerase
LTGLPRVDHGDAERDFALAVEEAAWRLAFSKEAGVAYSIEPHIGSICSNIAATHRLLGHVEGLTLTLDYGHFIFLGEESSTVHSLRPFASHIHARGGSHGRLQTAVAESTIDFEGMMEGLQSQHYGQRPARCRCYMSWSVPRKNHDSNITKSFEQAIAREEGYYSPTQPRPERDHNPGDIEWHPAPQGFAYLHGATRPETMVGGTPGRFAYLEVFVAR